MSSKSTINEALDYVREAVLVEIKAAIHKKRKTEGAYAPLYDLLKEYPFRKGKALRPTLCASVARAVGGMGHQALISSAALEFYHNAFLIHDDVEDGSENRRGKGTLPKMIGIARAVNIGDATNVLALSMLLGNISVLGVGKCLEIVHEIEMMALQSVEGQAMELDWVAQHVFDLTDQDYFRMCTKKTCWYTFISPCRIGYIIGKPYWENATKESDLAKLTEFGMLLGIAFQIQDDLLNLTGDEKKYGKEIYGDIYEGKRTIMLNHLISHAGPEKGRIQNILMTPRDLKKEQDVQFILDRMESYGSIEYGKNLARDLAQKANDMLEQIDFFKKENPVRAGEKWESEAVGFPFLHELVTYVITRDL